MKHRLFSLSLIFFLLLSLTPFIGISGVHATQSNLPSTRNSTTFTQCVIFTNSQISADRQKSYLKLLEVMGYSTSLEDSINLSAVLTKNPKMVLLPLEVSRTLDETSVSKLSAATEIGLSLILEVDSAVSNQWGLTLSPKPIRVHTLLDLSAPTLTFELENTLLLESFLVNDTTKPLLKDKISNEALLISKPMKSGGLIASTLPLLDSDNNFYKHITLLQNHISTVFKINPYLKRNGLSVFMDWGYHYHQNPKAVIQEFSKVGITTIYLSAWYPSNDFHVFADALIDEAHAAGIKVLLWLELPMVSKTFWDAHPELREKTARNQDAFLDWRYLMAIEDPRCFDLVKTEIIKRYEQHQWDGINLAEFYFESPVGLFSPELMTPFSPWVIDDYQSKTGINLLNLFDALYVNPSLDLAKEKERFLTYRTTLCSLLNEKTIQMLSQLIQPRQGELVVTQIDALMDPQLGRNIGIDSQFFEALRKTYNFTMMIEDPFTLWQMGPERYKTLDELYQKHHPKVEFAIDINIVDRRFEVYPSAKQTGLEFQALLSEASTRFDEVALYAAHTPFYSDLNQAAYALASPNLRSQLDQNTYLIEGDVSSRLQVNTLGKSITVNNAPWYAYNDSEILLPSGKSIVKLSAGTPKTLHITNFNETFTPIQLTANTLKFNYQSKSKTFVSFNRRPASLKLDGKALLPTTYWGTFGYTFRLPSGKHELLASDANLPIGAPIYALNGNLSNLNSLIVKKNNADYVPLNQTMALIKGSFSKSRTNNAYSISAHAHDLWFQLGQPKGIRDGKAFVWSAAPFETKGVCYVPVQDFFKQLGYNLSFNKENQLWLISE